MTAAQGTAAEARGILHLAAIRAWQAQQAGRPVPRLDPAALEQAIHEAFTPAHGWHPVEQLCEDWLDLARQHGIPACGPDGDPLPGILDTIEHTITAAIWWGITTGYLTLTGSYEIPAKLTGHL